MYSVHIRATQSPATPTDVVVNKRRTTSVRVSWQGVLNADRYNVTLSKTLFYPYQRGACYQGSHIVSVVTSRLQTDEDIVTSGLSVVVGRTDEDMLRPFTTYSVTVVAENNTSGSSEPSDPVTFTTLRTSEFWHPLIC